jgi:hypothetical protein
MLCQNLEKEFWDQIEILKGNGGNGGRKEMEARQTLKFEV